MKKWFLLGSFFCILFSFAGCVKYLNIDGIEDGNQTGFGLEKTIKQCSFQKAIRIDKKPIDSSGLLDFSLSPYRNKIWVTTHYGFFFLLDTKKIILEEIPRPREAPSHQLHHLFSSSLLVVSRHRQVVGYHISPPNKQPIFTPKYQIPLTREATDIEVIPSQDKGFFSTLAGRIGSFQISSGKLLFLKNLGSEKGGFYITKKSNSVYSMALDKQKKFLVAIQQKKPFLRAFFTKDLAPKKIAVDGIKKEIVQLIEHPSKNAVAFVDFDRSVGLINLSSWKIRYFSKYRPKINLYGNEIIDLLAFSSSGNTLFLSLKDKRIAAWDTKTGAFKFILSVKKYTIGPIFYTNGLLLAGDGAGYILAWRCK